MECRQSRSAPWGSANSKRRVEVTFPSIEEFIEWNKTDYFKNEVLPDEAKFIETLELYVLFVFPILADSMMTDFAGDWQARGTAVAEREAGRSSREEDWELPGA
jgi:hypothetical protein